MPKQSQGLSLHPWIGRVKVEQGLNFSSLKFPLPPPAIKKNLKKEEFGFKGNRKPHRDGKEKSFAVLSKGIRDKTHSWDMGIKGGALGHSDAVGAGWMHQKTRGKRKISRGSVGSQQRHSAARNRGSSLPSHTPKSCSTPTGRCRIPTPPLSAKEKTKKRCISLTNGQTHKQKKKKKNHH